MPQIQEGICGDLLDNACGPAIKSTPVPFFEFSVISEEGINLFVDISSSSLDWSKRLKNEVCLCQAFQENRFHSFRQELEYLQQNSKQIKCSVTWNTNSKTRTESYHANVDVSPDSFNRENNHLVNNFADAENGFSETSDIKQYKIFHEVSKHVEQEEEDPKFCGCDSCVKGLVASSMSSCPNRVKLEPMSGEVLCASQAKSTCGSTEILAANGPEVTWNCQNTELWNKTQMNMDIKNERCEADVGIPFSVSPAINSPEIQSSEVAGLCKDVAFSPFISDPLLNLFNTVETAKMGDGELAGSIQIDQNGHFMSSSVQEQVICFLSFASID